MTDDHVAPSSATGDTGQQVGWFRYYFDDERWEWSPQVARMHGYGPEPMSATTELVLSHKHRDDYQQIADALVSIRERRQPFSSRHRILDVQGSLHHVVVVGDLLTDDSGTIVGTRGFYIDVTPTESAHQDRLTTELAEITRNRAAIERAKGMLMLVYGISAEAAFDLLKWRSQESNVKLKLLAERIVADFSGQPRHGELPPQAAFDQLLLTVHQRIANSSEHGSVSSTTS
jgi:PAS domain S-box-containing protein